MENQSELPRQKKVTKTKNYMLFPAQIPLALDWFVAILMSQRQKGEQHRGVAFREQFLPSARHSDTLCLGVYHRHQDSTMLTCTYRSSFIGSKGQEFSLS